MADRRLSPADAIDLEARRNTPDGDDDADTGDDAPEDAQFVAVTEEDRTEANQAFRTLIAEGYVPVDTYNVHADPQGRKIVSLSVILPSSLEHSVETDDDGTVTPPGDDGGQ